MGANCTNGDMLAKENAALSSSCASTADSCNSCQKVDRPRWDSKQIANCRLVQAADDGDVKKIQEALDEGACIETVQNIKLRPQEKYNDMVQSWDEDEDSGGWISKEQQAMRKNRRPAMTPLMLAAKGGHALAVERLLDARAVASACESDGTTPMHFAASAGSEECCTLLIIANADPNVKDDFGRIPFAYLTPSCIYNQTERTKWKTLLSVP
jgi:hypothetical protein